MTDLQEEVPQASDLANLADEDWTRLNIVPIFAKWIMTILNKPTRTGRQPLDENAKEVRRKKKNMVTK